MADFLFSQLKEKYEEFHEPVAVIYINDKQVDSEESGLIVRKAEVELVSGFEAAIAEVTLSGAYDKKVKIFNTDKIKNYILLGSRIAISLGYGGVVREVFRGFIARVHFVVGYDTPAIVLTCMDVKGNLMADRHSRRLKARYYSDAVKEILDQNPFFTAKDDNGKDFITYNSDNTPDKPGGDEKGGGAGGAGGAAGGGEKKTDDVRIEMVEESDYEFIVKAARKFNFEFFSVGRDLYFCEAKKKEDILIELSFGIGLTRLDVGYDITGLVREVEVRNVDSDQGDYVGKSMKLNSNISMGNKAKPLVDSQTYVYIDPTVRNKEEAEYRANYLSSMMDYRLGSLRAAGPGLPELIPGRFMKIKEMGKPVENTFYLTRVRHIFTLSSFSTEIEGCANKIEK
ncbi:MAG: hypothetical protein K6A90_13860 [Lachnospiraceae bacterium]|nr:hypothetical protein [Lachnospiraceae bacterium]